MLVVGGQPPHGLGSSWSGRPDPKTSLAGVGQAGDFPLVRRSWLGPAGEEKDKNPAARGHALGRCVIDRCHKPGSWTMGTTNSVSKAVRRIGLMSGVALIAI